MSTVICPTCFGICSTATAFCDRCGNALTEAPAVRIEIDWTLKHPLLAGMLDKVARRTGKRLEAAQPLLRKIIAQAYEEGLSVRDTSDRIRAAIRDVDAWQADMLARTDLNSLSNGASLAAAQKAGMGYKTWLATIDSRTRREHAKADGQTVLINDVFVVGGEEAHYPGDPNLSDAMAANCRCTLVYA